MLAGFFRFLLAGFFRFLLAGNGAITTCQVNPRPGNSYLLVV